MALPQELWGNELREYLDGEALRCWLDLNQFDTDMTDWPHVKQGLTKSFCSVDRATLIYQMATNQWTVSPDWGKKLLGREVQLTAEGRDVGENQQPLVVQSHAGTTLQVEEGLTRNQDQGTGLTGDTAEANCQQGTSSQELRW
ncbi:hypothetical protein EBH_0020360 [Eimeria brunetti]|uniref:Uncharacterized protein n=1 Tax=Eimeria brunetti TaxID=51314 RepID=U6LIU7_9EIME|nr:hypothetical protein EBH_0020360 [Eimeria brunetti]